VPYAKGIEVQILDLGYEKQHPDGAWKWFTSHGDIFPIWGADMTPVVIDADKEAVKSYAKLVALKNMTPAQVSSWVDANVTNLSQAQDAIKTLSIGMGYIIRQIF